MIMRAVAARATLARRERRQAHMRNQMAVLDASTSSSRRRPPALPSVKQNTDSPKAARNERARGRTYRWNE
jgi:hypothetical protein